MSVTRLVPLVAVLVAMLATGSGCVSVGNLEERTVSLEAQGASAIQLSIAMGAGELRLRGGDVDLLEGSFETNVPDWMPRVSYRLREGGTGVLSVENDENDVGVPLGEATNDWDMTISQLLPCDLNLDMGVGEARVDLTRVLLNRAHIDLGIGELRLDLSQAWLNDVSVHIDSGIGEVRVLVPRSIGVRVHAESGIGSVRAADFARQGEDWVNDLCGKSPVTLTISIDMGIGDVRIVTAEEDVPHNSSLARNSLPAASLLAWSR